MTGKFVHLRLHSEYSLVDGLVRVKPLMDAVKERGMKAVAVTDYCNLFAAVKVYKAALGAGVKPILGADIPWVEAGKQDKAYSMLLLCQNETGYRNLTCLISKAYQEGQIQGAPRVQKSWFSEYNEGLIALSGAQNGDVGQALVNGNEAQANERAAFWQQLFGDRYYLEIQRVGWDGEKSFNERTVQLAQYLSLPLVATNSVCFIDEDDFDAHEARVCINQGVVIADPRRPKYYQAKQYLRSAEEMQTIFADLPSAIENAVEISKRCTVKLNLGDNFLPDFPVPAGDNIESFLSSQSKKGLEERLVQLYPNLTPEALASTRIAYDERLQIELDVINRMGFAGYFLIVADFIQWAKNHGVPVGPGRGSGAGSLVAYALEITDLDPLAYDLLFERFLNPERVSMPDFDIDFCMEGRDRVIEYVAEKYGRQSVSQIITFGSMAAKAVIRDVGRVLGHPYPFVDKIAKLIPFEIGITLTKALEQEPELKSLHDNDEDVKALFELALKLEGITRNAGKHAGGVVIAPSKLTDFTAVYCEQGSNQIVSQFDKDDVEAVGLVKFDFLGLRTLTIIDWALQTVNQQRQAQGLEPIDISQIPFDDDASFKLLKACQTTAVFQLESRGMKELIGRLQPDCFEDIVALVALFRPGPLQSGMVDDFIDRKHGRAEVAYPHPDLEPILKPTYGVILYQEQVMQIAQVLANYTLGAADMLRRAMGKKKPEEMAKQRAIFSEGAKDRGVDEGTATYIFDLMEKFAGYGFNKSHSAAYALVAYQTAWIKAHYPAAFMAAVMSSDMDNTDKVVNFIDECAQLKLKVLPPTINASMMQFTVNDQGEIVYGLGAIKGVGEAAIESIISQRQQNGPFNDLFDFCCRVETRKVNRRVIEALIKSGTFDEWQTSRATLFASIDKALRIAEKAQKDALTGQQDMFDLFNHGEEADEASQYAEVEPWPERQSLDGEKETLGFYLSGHPAKQYCLEFHHRITRIISLNPIVSKKAWICGQVMSIRKILTKRGKRLVIVNIDDASARIDCVVFGEIFDQHSHAVITGEMTVIEGDVAQDDFSGGVKITASRLLTIAEARSLMAKSLVVQFEERDHAKLTALSAIFRQYPGECPVQLAYQNGQAQAKLDLGAEWSVLPDDNCISAIRKLIGDDRVCFDFA
jgi:DNA polymerase-3 subunit alpha